eukprot:4260188-Prymnesium_polylepis.1
MCTVGSGHGHIIYLFTHLLSPGWRERTLLRCARACSSAGEVAAAADSATITAAVAIAAVTAADTVAAVAAATAASAC